MSSHLIRSCPRAWCTRGPGHGEFRSGPGWSDDHCGRSDDRIIAQRRHGFQRHVAGALDGRFVVLFEQDRSDEPDDGVLVGEDADDVGPALDLAVEPFEAVGRMDFRQWSAGKLL